MSKTRIVGSSVMAIALGCSGLMLTNSAVLVGERWEEPDTPRLAVLLGGRWTDGRRVDLKQLRLKCTYFTGASLVRQVHIVDHQREEGTFSCPSFARVP